MPCIKNCHNRGKYHSHCLYSRYSSKILEAVFKVHELLMICASIITWYCVFNKMARSGQRRRLLALPLSFRTCILLSFFPSFYSVLRRSFPIHFGFLQLPVRSCLSRVAWVPVQQSSHVVWQTLGLVPYAKISLCLIILIYLRCVCTYFEAKGRFSCADGS